MNTRVRPTAPRTAIIPAAGMGTRFLPATKTVPKELLPLGSNAAIEFVAEESASAGVDNMVLVVSPDKQSVTDYFRPLPGPLSERGKSDLLERVRHTSEIIDVDTVVQEQPLGLGHAVSCARERVRAGDDAVAVLLPDDLLLPTGVLTEMSRVRAEYGGSVLCAVEVDPEEVSSYGCLRTGSTEDEDVKRVHEIVEKPAPEQAPSRLAAVGRYLLDKAVFDALDEISPGHGGELQLTDAIGRLIGANLPVHVVVARGKRHDLGNPLGFVKANVDLVSCDPTYGPELEKWLKSRS